MSILAEVFEQDNALDKLEGFASLHGPKFYGLAANETTLTLTKGDAVSYPTEINTAEGPVTVFDPMMPLHWQVS